MQGILLRRRGAIAEAPFPRSGFPGGFVVKGHQPTPHVDNLERPVRLEFPKLRLDRHQLERHQLVGLAEHRVLPRKIPERVLVAGGIVVIEHRPGHSDQLVLPQRGLHRPPRSLAPGVVEGRDPELERQLPRFSRLEIVVVGGVGIGQFLHVGITAPRERPVFSGGRGHDVIILRVHAVHRKMRVALAELLGGLEALDQRAAREIAVHHQLEDVVVQTGLGEVPVVVVGLV